MESEFIFSTDDVVIKLENNSAINDNVNLIYCGFDSFPYMYILSFNNKKEILSYNKGVVLYVDNRSYHNIKIGDYYKNINKEISRNVLEIGHREYYNSEEYPLGSFIVRGFSKSTV